MAVGSRVVAEPMLSVGADKARSYLTVKPSPLVWYFIFGLLLGRLESHTIGSV